MQSHSRAFYSDNSSNRRVPTHQFQVWGVPPHPTPGIKGLSWFGVAHTSNFPPLCTQSQAQPEPNWVLAAFEKRSLKASKLPNDSLMAVAKAAEGALRRLATFSQKAVVVIPCHYSLPLCCSCPNWKEWHQWIVLPWEFFQ